MLLEKDRFPILKKLFTLFFRVLPFRTKPGIFEIGKPVKSSPLIVTTDYYLTFKRVVKTLKGVNCFLLIVPSNGINVWCASSGNILNIEKLICAVDSFHLKKYINHNNLILPQLAASGISKWRFERDTDWKIHWGPVDIADLTKYLNENKILQTDESDRFVEFTSKNAFEMSFALTGSIFLRFSWIAFVLLSLKGILIFQSIIWLSSFLGYLLISIKSNTVFSKSYLISILLYFVIIVFFGLTWQIFSLLIISIALLYWTFNSYLPYVPCNYESAFYGKENGPIINSDSCTLCGECLIVCPVNSLTIENGKMVICQSSCISCGACFNQCAYGSIKLPKSNTKNYSH
jgi:NAD-dependent dihydropyrimidine dehydrogenase PreA subunit